MELASVFTTELLLALAAIAGIVLVAGIVHSAIGFGFGIVSLAVLPFIIDARSAHVMMSMCSVPMLLMAAWAYRDGIDWPSLRPALLGAAIMMPVGVFLFSSMSLDLLVRGTGLAILLMTCLSLRNRSVQLPSEPGEAADGSRVASFTAGAIGGFLGGAVSIAGPPVATFALNQGWRPERFKAFVTQCLLVISIYKTTGLAVAGLITQTTVGQAVWATPFAMVGIQIGVVVSRKIDAQKFQIIVAVVLIGVACLLMFRGQP